MINKVVVLTILLSGIILGIATGILAVIEETWKRNEKKKDNVGLVAFSDTTRPDRTELQEETKEFIEIKRERRNKKQIAEEFIQRVRRKAIHRFEGLYRLCEKE